MLDEIVGNLINKWDKVKFELAFPILRSKAGGKIANIADEYAD